MDYKNGKIYCIRSHQTDKVYIGSTTQPLYKRLSGHKGHMKYYNSTGKKYITSYEIVKFEDAYIELVELHPCNSKEELLKKEGGVIRTIPNCINRRIAGRKPEEYRSENKEHKKAYDNEYNTEYSEKIKEKAKVYYEGNKEQIKQKVSKYREDNSEKIKADQAYHREKNKEKQKEYNENYRENNKEKIKLQAKQYHARKKAEKEALKQVV